MISINSIRPEPAVLAAEILGRIWSVLVAGNFILGMELVALEAEFVAAYGAQFAVGVNAGLDALPSP